MKKHTITTKQIEKFRNFLKEEERSQATIDKYTHDIQCFMDFIKGAHIDKTITVKYKEALGMAYAVSSANSMIAALNCFLRFMGWDECCVKQFKLQKNVFCTEEKELTKTEYIRLVKTAKSTGKERLSLIIQTICGTGIRVSELEYITVEAVLRGQTLVSCKNKTRTVFIVRELQKRLINYIKKQGVKSGPVFVTKSGKPVSRCNIWREMKAICKKAGVLPEKVFPHNLRHLFARTFYGLEKDIVKLADILGHTSINTTRIYVVTTGEEHRKRMESMKLII